MMKPAHFALHLLKRHLRSGELAMLFDFDGTLSAIAPTPRAAVISRKNRQALRELRRHAPIAIISGRSLSDIKRKVGIPGLLYAGNHGLEWEIEGKRSARALPANLWKLLVRVQRAAKPTVRDFPGSFIENKRLTLAVHYRKLKESRAPLFCKKLQKALSPFAKTGLVRIDHHQKTFDVRPDIGWTKGEVAREILKYFGVGRKKLTPLYIGDSVTDEDAFRVLPRSITIRVGKKKASAAKYFVERRSEVDTLLARLVSSAHGSIRQVGAKSRA